MSGRAKKKDADGVQTENLQKAKLPHDVFEEDTLLVPAPLIVAIGSRSHPIRSGTPPLILRSHQ